MAACWLTLLTLLQATLPSPAWTAPASGCTENRSDETIAYYARRVAEHPGLYPAHTGLAAAYLEQARETADPDSLSRARAALERSLALQPSYEAMALLASVALFAHRFEEALQWSERAAAASPADGIDTRLLPGKVEALLALGADGEVPALFAAAGERLAADCHLLIARAQWLRAEDKHDDAVAVLERAAGACQGGSAAPALTSWAEVAIAGILIDTGRPELARPHLEAARAVDPCRRDLRLHQAELLEAEGKDPEALQLYETLLEQGEDPFVRHRAFLIARRLGRQERAGRHLALAESGYQRAIDRGEIYTLEALARLYLDAAIHPERARALAEENLRFKRDRGARRILAEALARQPEIPPAD